MAFTQLRYFALLCVVFGSWSPSVRAQRVSEATIDSLNAHSLQLLAYPDSLAVEADKVYRIAKKSSYTRGAATAAKIMGVASYFHSKFDESIAYYSESLALYEQLNDTLEIAKAYLNIATSLGVKGSYEKTIEQSLIALRFFQQLGDANGEGRVYNLMGVTAHAHEDYAKALSYFKKHLDKAINVSDSVEIATSYNNIGTIYKELGNVDSAIAYLLRSEKVNRQIGFERNNGNVYQNLGSLYEGQRQFDRAQHFNRQALDIHRSVGDRQRESELLYNMGYVYHRQQRLNEAEAHFGASIEVAREIGYVAQLAKSASELALVKADQGDYHAAYNHQREAAVFRDSAATVERLKEANELRTKFETEQKEQQIELLNRQATIQQLGIRQRNLYLAIASLLFLAAVCGAWLIHHNKRLRERQLKKEALLKEQLLRFEAQNALQQDRLRISRELHDNIGSQLTFIKSTVDGNAQELSSDEAFRQVREMTDGTIRELRKTVWLINKPSVEADEFTIKLRAYFDGRSDITVVTTGLVGVVLTSPVATQLFRVIQEAVNNAMKHASASRIEITLDCPDGILKIAVTDNGRGFRADEVNEGFGMMSMRSRMEEVHGSMTIESAPGKGTVVGFHLPITKQDTEISV